MPDDPLTDAGRRLAGWLPATARLADLERSSTKFVEGLARIGDVIAVDGALPGSLKLLFAAAICAVKRDASPAVHFLGAAAAAGLAREHAEGAALGVLISRGVAAHGVFAAAIEAAYGPGGGGGSGPAEHPVDVAAAYRHFGGYFGAVPDYVELLGERAGRALEGYFLMREAALGETGLPARDTELMLCAVNTAEYQAPFVAIHARGARRAGATEAQLVEAAVTALPLVGLAAWLLAARGILDSRDAG